jgi:hypothetical protein
MICLRSTTPRVHCAGWVTSMRCAIAIQHTQFTLIHTVGMGIELAVRSPPKRCLTISFPAPSLSSDITSSTNTNAPRTVVAPRTPGPSRAPCDGEMVPAKGKPRARYANQRTEQQIKTEVTEIGEARACYVYGGADGYQDKHEGVNGRCSVLVANRYYSVVVVGGRVRES